MSDKPDNGEISVKQDTSCMLHTMLENITLTKDCESYCQQQVKAKTTIEIPDKLKDCEYPFHWWLEEKRGRTSEEIVQLCKIQMEEFEVEDTLSYSWIVTLLTLGLELSLLGELEESWASVEKIDSAIMEDSDSNSFYHNHKDAIQHILGATKCHIMMLNGTEAVTELSEQQFIPPIQLMNSQNQAAVFAMKSYFYVFSHYDNENFVEELARKAMELERNNEEWMFLLAIILRLKRRHEYPRKAPQEEEQSLLEQVVAKSSKCRYLVYLAQYYRESQTFQFKTKQPDYNSECYQSIQEMAKKSLNIYKEALQMKPYNAEILRRVGYGLMNLPKDYKDLKLALECLTSSLKIKEHVNTLHILGNYYERNFKDYEKALHFYERAISKPTRFAHFDVARLKYILDPEFDPCSFLEETMKLPMNDRDLISFLAQLGGFHLLVKKDLIKSIEYFSQIVALDKDTPYMTQFYSCFYGHEWREMNLYKYLMTESLMFLDQEVDETIKEEDKEKVKNFLTSINDKVDLKWKDEPNYSKDLQKNVNQRRSSSRNYNENWRNSSSSKNCPNWRNTSASKNVENWRKPSSNK